MSKSYTKESPAGFEKRKAEHISLALAPENQASDCSTFNTIQLIHEALPELNFNDVSIESTRWGKPTRTPFFVSSMTAGHAGAIDINDVLANACSQTGWAMGVGSQRRQLFDANHKNEWETISTRYPSVNFFANIGIAQIIGTPVEQLEQLVDSLSAEALIVHLNPLQETLQPEGTPNFTGSLDAITQLTDHISVPVIIKETGCGFTASTLQRLNGTGIAAVDVSGLGGTHWGRIEGKRAQESTWQAIAAQTFKSWGISTIDSLIAAKSLELNFEIWGSGGVRSGLDAAKCIALDATSIGLAKPLLDSALQGVDAVVSTMQQFEDELRIALFCTGSATVSALKEKYHVIT